MSVQNLTIGETIEQLHKTLREYIEATYHISNPGLIVQRQALLNELGVIHQQPYIESTPRYRTGKTFKNLGLDPSIVDMFSLVSTESGGTKLIHDPPYQHQAESIQETLINGKSLLVMTGTGSGKTECFLLPILGNLSKEASSPSGSFHNYQGLRAIIVYPMNALVNDQLGRLRLLFGDPRIIAKFKELGGRPVRFARYTSRTLYPGVRTVDKDTTRLSPIERYYVHHLRLAQDPSSPKQESAKKLVEELKRRGKWPAKQDLIKWYGEKNSRWHDTKTGKFKRCVTLPDDAELLSRHEVLESAPDILITNYSMLEYMLLRPIERPIFNQTREWLHDNKDEKLLLVLDEAHLYRGAGGTEVALLLRRFRMRLGIPADRLQVICTSASFNDPDYAAEFAAQLSGKSRREFKVIKGDLMLRDSAGQGSREDAEVLAKIDLNRFYSATSDELRLNEVKEFLIYRNVKQPSSLHRSLYEALEDFPPMSTLINLTMKEALPVGSIATKVFPNIPDSLPAKAVTTLIALGSVARLESNQPSLLPCRVHSFYRGLPGLWVCMDPMCTELEESVRGGIVGKLYSQPRDMCACGARVLELYTCRNCGTAYARAYTNKLEEPDFLWSESGGEFRTLTGRVVEINPLDLLLEDPLVISDVEPAEYDIVSGRLNPNKLGPRNRKVYIRRNRYSYPDNEENKGVNRSCSPGEFIPCGVCGEQGSFGRSSVQDHQTKGDQPLQALIAKQIHVQPPNAIDPTPFAPLRGRKVLVFSDSRQVAARLAPNLQMYSNQDTLRPLIIVGFKKLQSYGTLRDWLSLEDVYLAVLIAAKLLGVRLRPELKTGESSHGENRIWKAIQNRALDDHNNILQLWAQSKNERPPESLLRGIIKTLTDRYYGIESLALASIIERSDLESKLGELPEVPGIATTKDQKIALARIWIRAWNRKGFWLNAMPQSWWNNEVGPHSGNFQEVQRFFPDKKALSVLNKVWIPNLLDIFTESVGGGAHKLRGSELSLKIGGDWAYCEACRTTQRPFPGLRVCINCGLSKIVEIDPDNDQAFAARKGYYRSSTIEALKQPPCVPMALIAAEHTAQLNTAQADEVFSKAEEHELLFQDVDLGILDGEHAKYAIDVLSCTTTMEVGIDIGSLSGVSLRNMPPARSNYQQRAGRAGRRGNAVASVTAFGSADSHDEHYFTHPDQMIRGTIEDPRLTLDNREIARRHITAYLLQRYHETKLPKVTPEEEPQIFAVLGKVSSFKNASSILNRSDLEQWLKDNETELRSEVNSWLPHEVMSFDRNLLLDKLREETLRDIDKAINYELISAEGAESAPDFENEDDENENDENEDDEENPNNSPRKEIPLEEGEEQSNINDTTENLIDRLLYKGVLPRYAFPTDVVTFHVFDPNASRRNRPIFRFTPSQGLTVALTQYAPGKDIWIAGKLYTSGAIYSPMPSDRFHAWENKKLYYECIICHYGRTFELSEGEVGELRDCQACGGINTFGVARYWIRPPGFAHPINLDEGTSPDDQPPRSFATRAKLIASTPVDEHVWITLNDHIRIHYIRDHLLVTNRGPRQEGYIYCTRCGLIEPSVAPKINFIEAHRKPFPDNRDINCSGGRAVKGLVLGTDFITDVLLISLRVEPPLMLRPGILATEVALRTICEALTKAACNRMELEATELQAEYRPALTPAGKDGSEAEIYIYDTLSGGAGFSRRAGQLGLAIFEDALQILESCPDNCDRSCYRCLRSYKNKFEHDLLDRYLGASLLRYLLKDSPPTLDMIRLERSTNLLFEDLKRQGVSDLTIERNKIVTIPGIGSLVVPILITRKNDGMKVVVGMRSPLTIDYTADTKIQNLKEYSVIPVHLEDELVVRRNLPSATDKILKLFSKGD